MPSSTAVAEACLYVHRRFHTSPDRTVEVCAALLAPEADLGSLRPGPRVRPRGSHGFHPFVVRKYLAHVHKSAAEDDFRAPLTWLRGGSSSPELFERSLNTLRQEMDALEARFGDVCALFKAHNVPLTTNILQQYMQEDNGSFYPFSLYMNAHRWNLSHRFPKIHATEFESPAWQAQYLTGV